MSSLIHQYVRSALFGLAAFVLLFPVAAIAQGPGFGPDGGGRGGQMGPPGGGPGGPGGQGRHSGKRLEQVIEELDLPAETLKKVDAILDEAHVSRREIRRELRSAHEVMRELLEQDNPAEETVMAQLDVIGGLDTEVQKERLRTMLRVRKLLTPEQRIKLSEQMESRRGEKGRRGRGSQRGLGSQMGQGPPGGEPSEGPPSF